MPRRCWPRSSAPKSRARRTARGEVGRIAVGFTTSAPFHPLVARAIREFRASRPDVSFVLEESGSGDMVSGLREERLDIAFIRSGLVDPQGLTVHALLQEDMAAAFPARHRLARRPQPHAQGSRATRPSSSTAGPTGAASTTSSSRPAPRRASARMSARRRRASSRRSTSWRRASASPSCRPRSAACRWKA